MARFKKVVDPDINPYTKKDKNPTAYSCNSMCPYYEYGLI